MIVNYAQRGARGVGRFLTTSTNRAIRKLEGLNDAYNRLDDASMGLVDNLLTTSGVKPAIQTITNPLVSSIKAANYLGRGLSTLGEMDLKKINTKSLGSGIHDLGQAYALSTHGRELRFR